MIKINLKILLFSFILIIVGASNLAIAKESKDFIKKGNSLYKKDKFKDAEVQYRKALEVEPNSNIAKFNLGTSYYRQGIFDKAKESFDGVDNKSFDKKDLAGAYYNLGNSLLQDKKYEESIESYKKALVNDPNDKDAKYNLEYARSMLQKQMQQQQQNQQNQNNKDQNKDKNNQQQQNQQNQNNKDQNKDKQDQQNQDNNQAKNQDKQGQQQQPKISKKDAEQILQALTNEEKNVQKKLKAKAAVKGKLDKNW